MSTDVTRVYASFLQKISDYKFNEDLEYVESTLFGYYTTATAEFVQCRKDLGTNYNGLSEKPEKVLINSDLTQLEIEILAMLMLVEYFKQIMIRNETIEQALSDSDFKILSQANHINQLKDLWKEVRKETSVKINKYTFVGAVYDKKWETIRTIF